MAYDTDVVVSVGQLSERVDSRGSKRSRLGLRLHSRRAKHDNAGGPPVLQRATQLVELTDAILDVDVANEVCIVDDSSPDGTAAAVQEALATRPGWGERVHLIVRDKHGSRRRRPRGFDGESDAGVRGVRGDGLRFLARPRVSPDGLAVMDQGFTS